MASKVPNIAHAVSHTSSSSKHAWYGRTLKKKTPPDDRKSFVQQCGQGAYFKRSIQNCSRWVVSFEVLPRASKYQNKGYIFVMFERENKGNILKCPLF